MHIGSDSVECQKLQVHGHDMQYVDTDTYLGDKINRFGKNGPNIDTRVSRGLGLVTQIEHILNIVSLGENYFRIALILRESMLVNSMLSSSNIWYGLKKKDIDRLESVDKLLLSKLLRTKSTTPYESYFLELGILPLGVLIKSRRVKYLNYLVSRNQKETLYKFFKKQ